MLPDATGRFAASKTPSFAGITAPVETSEEIAHL
jgi:hypothetical protein